MLAVVGAAVGSWSVRAAVVDAQGRTLLGFEVVEAADPDDRTSIALDLIESLSSRYGASPRDAVLVVPDEPGSRIGTDMYAVHDADQVHLASELGAQVTYLEARGLIERCRHLAIVDIGRSGVGISVVDVVGGEVLGSGHCRLFGGDYCADMVYQYLLDAIGPRVQSIDPAEILPLEFGSEWAVEMLATHRSVRVPGPFADGPARLWRQTLDNLIRPGLRRSIRWAREGLAECPVTIDGVALVGGCANLPSVRTEFAEALGGRAITPTAPETASAKGAALLAARGVGHSGWGWVPGSSAPDVDVRLTGRHGSRPPGHSGPGVSPSGPVRSADREPGLHPLG